MEDGINEHEGPVPVMDSKTEASMDACTACSTSSGGGGGGGGGVPALLVRRPQLAVRSGPR